MVLSVYRIALLKGFLRKFSRVGECTICYDRAYLHSLHQEGNLHGICRTCIDSYNKTVCHICRAPIPEEILTRWNIQEEPWRPDPEDWIPADQTEVDLLVERIRQATEELRRIDQEEQEELAAEQAAEDIQLIFGPMTDDSDDDSDDEEEHYLLRIDDSDDEDSISAEDADSDSDDEVQLRETRAHCESLFYKSIVEPMNSIVETSDTYTTPNLQLILANARRIMHDFNYVASRKHLTIVHEVTELIEATKKHRFTHEHFCSLWNRIQNYGPLDSAGERTISFPGRPRDEDATIINHPGFYQELAVVGNAVSQIEWLLLDLEDCPKTSVRKLNRIIGDIDYEASKLEGKLSDSYVFFNAYNENLTLSMLLNREYNF